MLKTREQMFFRTLAFYVVVVLCSFCCFFGAKYHHGGALWFLIANFLLSVMMIYLAIKMKRVRSTSQPSSPRPVLYFWPFENQVGLCTEEDYELWYNQRKRIAFLYVLRGEKLPRARVSPQVMMVFTDHPAKAKGLGPYYTGSLANFEAITVGCDLRRREMHVPATQQSMEAHRRFPVSWSVAWQLIHGHPAPVVVETTEPQA
jgi:hypothetical protein